MRERTNVELAWLSARLAKLALFWQSIYTPASQPTVVFFPSPLPIRILPYLPSFRNPFSIVTVIKR